MILSNFEAELGALHAPATGTDFRAAQLRLVSRTRNADAPFWCFATSAEMAEASEYWSEWILGHDGPLERRRGIRVLSAEQRWLTDVVMPELTSDPASWAALPTFFSDRQSTAVILWPRPARQALSSVVKQLVAYSGARLAALVASDESESAADARLRYTAIDLMNDHPDVTDLKTLATSMDLPFPQTQGFTRCFYRAQETLVGFLEVADAPFFPMASRDERARARKYWEPRSERRVAPYPDPFTNERWRRDRAVDAYRALGPVTDDPTTLHDQMVDFLLRTFSPSGEVSNAGWSHEPETSALARLRHEALPAYARLQPDPRFVPALAELLPAEGPVGSWLRVGSLFEIQRSLVALTGRDKAPVAYADDRESVYEAARFWRGWWRDHGEGFASPPPEVSEAAMARWTDAGASGRRWRRMRDRARGIVRPFTGPAAALLGIFGLVWWGVAEEASKRRRRRHRLPGIIWWPAQILWLVLFMLALTVFAVLSSIPHLLSGLALGILQSLWLWRRRFRAWRRGR